MVRCVVAGEEPGGRSVVVSDATLEFTPVALLGPETQFFRLWGSDQVSELPSDGTPPSFDAYFPPPGGFRFMASTLGPDSSRPAAVEDVDAAMVELEGAMPGFSQWADPDNPHMHRTDTIDFDIVVSGEVWLELDHGAEVHLRAGDCVILNGVRHAWHNRSTEPCQIFGALIGATRSP
jgi:mannose-6-phosphate isomerase-like protein (cupin superfamily)